MKKLLLVLLFWAIFLLSFWAARAQISSSCNDVRWTEVYECGNYQPIVTNLAPILDDVFDSLDDSLNSKGKIMSSYSLLQRILNKIDQISIKSPAQEFTLEYVKYRINFTLWIRCNNHLNNSCDIIPAEYEELELFSPECYPEDNFDENGHRMIRCLVDVKNIGNMKSAPFRIHFYIDGNDEGRNGFNWVESWKSTGKSWAGWYLSPGEHTITFQLVPEGNDVYSPNNRFTITTHVDWPDANDKYEDLSVADVMVDQQGETFDSLGRKLVKLAAHFENLGNIDSKSFGIQYAIDGDRVWEISGLWGLRSGQRRTSNKEEAMFYLTPGNHSIVYWVLPQWSDRNTSNNSFVKNIYISSDNWQYYEDLRIYDGFAGVQQNFDDQGRQEVKINAYVKNIGTQLSEGFDVELFVDGESMWRGNGYHWLQPLENEGPWNIWGWSFYTPGQHVAEFILYPHGDDVDTSNNTITVNFGVGE